jgi:NADH-quinone oxidoreductase subunit K
MIIPIEHFLIVSASLFVIGVFGIFLNRKNIIIILMSIELILASVNINFVVFSSYLGDLVGQVFAMFILTVAAAEAAIGLAILVSFYRLRNSIFIEDANTMKG